MEGSINVTIALIAAGSAIFGASVSQLFAMVQSNLDKKHQRHILLREKYESLAEEISLSLIWRTNDSRLAALDDINAHSVPVHARHVLTLASIYFPELIPLCADHLNSQVKFHFDMLKGFQDGIGVSAGAQAMRNYPKAYVAALEGERVTRQKLDEAIIKYAKIYARA